MQRVFAFIAGMCFAAAAVLLVPPVTDDAGTRAAILGFAGIVALVFAAGKRL